MVKSHDHMHASNSATPARESLTVAGLFAGIGGIERGFHQAGHSTELLCEIDPAAARVLRRQFPEVSAGRFFPDVTEITEIKKFPRVDVIAAGFPCQDLSQAGRTAGIAGTQSSLVEHVFRLLDLAKTNGRRAWQPRWLLFENVPFMLQLESGKGMRYLVDQLEARHFTWAYRVIDANAFGLPQRRHRVILLASQSEDPRRVLFREDASPFVPEFLPELWCGFYWTEGSRGLGWAVDAVPTLKGGSTIGIPSPPAIWVPQTGLIGTPSIRDAERLQGFDIDWTLPAVAEKFAAENEVLLRRLKNHRWKLVGNAVSVPLAKWVGDGLAAPGHFNESLGADRQKPGVAWPKAAWGRNGEVYPVDVSTWPVCAPRVHLSDFLEDDLVALSARATAGFDSRINAESCKLRFQLGFKKAIKTHLKRMRQRAQVAVA
jgi:DNA (cytosine-5)-methyltransferase 1